MNWDKDNIENIVLFINEKLGSGEAMVKIEREYFGENERVIHKRLMRLGYKKIDNQYTLNRDITSKITPKTSDLRRDKISNVITPMEVIRPTEGQINGIKDIDKLNLLIDNIDKILKLIPTEVTSNITNIRSGRNDVKSFRIDTGLYAAIKEKSLKDSINISEIINRSLEDYLNNYL